MPTTETDFQRGMRAEREIRWALRHLKPNIAFGKVMVWVGGGVTLLILWAVAQDPSAWPLLLLAIPFGMLPVLAPAAIRQERADAARACEILDRWGVRHHAE